MLSGSTICSPGAAPAGAGLAMLLAGTFTSVCKQSFATSDDHSCHLPSTDFKYLSPESPITRADPCGAGQAGPSTPRLTQPAARQPRCRRCQRVAACPQARLLELPMRDARGFSTVHPCLREPHQPLLRSCSSPISGGRTGQDLVLQNCSGAGFCPVEQMCKHSRN